MWTGNAGECVALIANLPWCRKGEWHMAQVLCYAYKNSLGLRWYPKQDATQAVQQWTCPPKHCELSLSLWLPTLVSAVKIFA